MSGITAINRGLDWYFQYQRDIKGRVTKRYITRQALVYCIEQATGITYSAEEVSTLLQVYRSRQQDDATMRYRIAARGYGRNAMWYVMAGPKLAELTGEGMTMAHAEWIVRDIANRASSDFMRELLPAATSHPSIEQRCQLIATKILHVLTDGLNDVIADKELWEKAEARIAEVLAQRDAADHFDGVA